MIAVDLSFPPLNDAKERYSPEFEASVITGIGLPEESSFTTSEHHWASVIRPNSGAVRITTNSSSW